MTKLERAARAWWASRRPFGWTIDDHLKSPITNMTTPRETALAMAVASAIRKARKR